MEAFAALGVACNILQLISCGLQVASVSKQIYEKGSTDHNDEVSESAKQMTLITASLDHSLKTLSSHGQLTKDQEELRKLALSCQDVSAKLQREIDRVGVNGQKRRWRAIPASIKSMMHQKGIDDLEKRLKENRDRLQTQLLADLHVQQEAATFQQTQQYSQMEQSFQDLVAKLAIGFPDLSDLVLDTHSDLTKLIQTEGRDVRDHITARLQFHELSVMQRRQRERLLESLQYPEMNERISSLTEAHETTFEWLFQREDQGSWSNFVDWLETDNDIYWISGKPGSGKSVLMKFLFGHQKTMECLSSWAGGNPVFKVHFFIWKAGHPLQSKRKGLLASLVRQLVHQSDDFARKVWTRQDITMKGEIADWSVTELCDLLTLFTKMKVASLCIFLDGLDETNAADGDLGMLKLTRWLCGMSGVKVCAASRPEPEFRIALAECPQLTLQALTETDLQKYAIDQLKEVGQQQFLSETDPSSVPQRLQDIVLAKADGVFLWVRLAIANISRGLQRMDGWEELTRRLDQLPSELQDLYHDMWQRNREDLQNYQEEAAQYFQIVLESPDTRVSSFEITVMFGKCARSLLQDPQSNISRAQILLECERIEQRVLNCCLGLLETRPKQDYDGGNYSRDGVVILDLQDDETAAKLDLYQHRMFHFIHYTAIEFLRGTSLGDKGKPLDLSMPRDRSKARLDAAIIAPFCVFPVIDLNGLYDMFSNLAKMDISDQEKIRYVKTFETLHQNFPGHGNKDEHLDVCRNWIDSVYAGKWTLKSESGSESESESESEDHNGMFTTNPSTSPSFYALGWLNMVARVAVLPYWECMLAQTLGHTVSRNFASWLAMSAAYNDFTSPGDQGYSWEIRTIKLINLAIKYGADIDATFPLVFGHTPCIDVLPSFCCVFSRDMLPDERELEVLLQEVGTALSKLKDDTRTVMRLFDVVRVPEEGVDERMQLRSTPAYERYPLVGNTFILEMNTVAMIRFYFQCLGASDLQIHQLLEGRSAPKCTLLASISSCETKDIDDKLGIRIPSSNEDTDRFYIQLDKCSELSPLLLSVDTDLEADEVTGTESGKANLEFVKLLREIRERGIAIAEDDLMSSVTRSWKRVTRADIPFVRPFADDAPDPTELIQER